MEKLVADKKALSKGKLRSSEKEKTETSSAKSSTQKHKEDKSEKGSKTTRSSTNHNSKSSTSTSSKSQTVVSSKKPKKLNVSCTNGKRATRSRVTNSQIPQLDGLFDDDDFNILQLDGNNDSSSPSKPNLKKLRSTSKNKTKNKYKDSSTSDDEFASSKNVIRKPNLKKLNTKKTADVKNDIIKIMKSRIKEEKDLNRQKNLKRKSLPKSEEDSDYLPEEISKKRRDSEDDFVPKTKVKKRVEIEKNKIKKQGVDVWIEVFLEMEEKWISVDVPNVRVHCTKELLVILHVI